MTVIINKPGFNLREALTSLKRKIGIKGAELMAAETVSDVYNVIGTNRNKIINGAMVIDQRNAGASKLISSNTNSYILDRWRIWVYGGDASSATLQQSTLSPEGFINSLQWTVTSADTSLSSGDYHLIAQYIEGFNAADFGWGATNAQPATLSFWVRSSVVGIYGCAVSNETQSRSYPFTYTINAANVWERKVIVIPGDITGTWQKTTSAGILLFWSLGTGSTYQGTPGIWDSSVKLTSVGCLNLMATANATFNITGVQLEVGTVATPFEHRPYGTELALCQRYFYSLLSDGSSNGRSLGITGVVSGGNTTRAGGFHPVPMRAIPTITIAGLRQWDGSAAPSITGISLSSCTKEALSIDVTGGGLTDGRAGTVLFQGNVSASQGYLKADAEL